MNAVFPPSDAKGTLVDFGRPVLLNTLFRIWRKALRDKLTNPELAFITRAELGLYNLLHHLGAKVDTRGVWLRVLERAGTLATEARRRQR